MKGYTFYFDDEKHLWFVISKPDPDEKVLIVNCTTVYNVRNEDRSCILNKGDHPCITHESYVAYKHAREINTLKINYKERYGEVKYKEHAQTCVIKRIQEGAKITYFLNPEFEKYFDYFD